MLLVGLLVRKVYGVTYSSILGCFSPSSLECGPVALVLKTLRSNQSLDLGGLGVGLLSLTFGLDFAADDELANLQTIISSVFNPGSSNF
jgi:hypothetical protein